MPFWIASPRISGSKMFDESCTQMFILRETMKEKIYTVPINEAFEAGGDGCPLCLLRARTEEDSLRYVLGAAVMEPDVRAETNERGFCAAHLARLMAGPNRLSLALALESLYARLRETGREGLYSLDCYVCRRVDGFMTHFRRNIVWMWQTEPDFAARLAGRSLCLPHAAAQLETARTLLRRRAYEDFSQALYTPAEQRVADLQERLSAFCVSFDHRQAGRPLDEETRTAVERAAAFLGGDSV
jgi:hypothetical protein